MSLASFDKSFSINKIQPISRSYNFETFGHLIFHFKFKDAFKKQFKNFLSNYRPDEDEEKYLLLKNETKLEIHKIAHSIIHNIEN